MDEEIEYKPMFPGATLDFSCDWVDWLRDGEEVASFQVTAGPNLVVNSSSASATAITAWITMAGAMPIGETTKLKFKLVSNSTPPRTDYRVMHLKATERAV